VIAMSSRLEDGSPFPTTFWLTCPAAVAAMHACESAGEHVAWARRAGSDPQLAEALRAADAAYRAARAVEAGGDEPASGGVGGERDPLRVKCLHARVAASLGGVPDPVGERYVAVCAAVMAECDGRRCSETLSGDVS